MNGETRLTLKGIGVGAFAGIVITLFGAGAGWGALSNRVAKLEYEVLCLRDLRDKVIQIQVTQKDIKEKLEDLGQIIINGRNSELEKNDSKRHVGGSHFYNGLFSGKPRHNHRLNT